tara:strand:+ start:948 stop:1685 length:738 start_codon:yes stop_codon:yes gene_type:complete
MASQTGKPPPKVSPIKSAAKETAKYHHEYLPEVGVGVRGKGALLCLLSPRNTGKTTCVSNLFLNKKGGFYGHDFFSEIYIISPTINLDQSARHLKERYITFDVYHPQIIQEILKTQEELGDDAPEIAIYLDDCVGLMDKEIDMLCTRSRHYNIKLLVIASQKFRGALSPIIRANITDLIVGSPFPNARELDAISDEFGDEFMGKDNWMRLYREATPNKYDFAYMKLTNPPRMFHNFEEELDIKND